MPLFSPTQELASQRACPEGSAAAAQYPHSSDGEVSPLAAAEAQLGSVCNVYWVGAWPEEAGVKTLTVAEYEVRLPCAALRPL